MTYFREHSIIFLPLEFILTRSTPSNVALAIVGVQLHLSRRWALLENAYTKDLRSRPLLCCKCTVRQSHNFTSESSLLLQEPMIASTSASEPSRPLGEGIRADFPILGQHVHGDKQLIYFDNGATSQKPKQVLEALREYNEGYNSNVHRGVHYLSAKVRAP